MKAAVVAAAAILMTAMPFARAQITSTAIPNSPWITSTFAGNGPACSMSGAVGQGQLSLTVLGALPGVVHLQLDKRGWSMAPGSQVRAIFHFAGASDVELTGTKGGAASVLFNLMAVSFRNWVHGFSAAQSAAIEFPGTSEPPWTFDLRGTTPAISAIQKCITAQGIAGVPLPFVSAAVPPAVKPGSHCVAYDPAVSAITGTVGVATAYGPPGFGENPKTDPKFSYAQLTLDRPVCVTGGKAFDYEDVDGVHTMELFYVNHGQVFDAKPWFGKHVAVTGLIEQAQVATEAATRLYVNVKSIQEVP